MEDLDFFEIFFKKSENRLEGLLGMGKRKAMLINHVEAMLIKLLNSNIHTHLWIKAYRLC